MKKFRKLLALVLAVAMVCAVSVTAWAEETDDLVDVVIYGDNDRSITACVLRSDLAAFEEQLKDPAYRQAQIDAVLSAMDSSDERVLPEGNVLYEEDLGEYEIESFVDAASGAGTFGVIVGAISSSISLSTIDKLLSAAHVTSAAKFAAGIFGVAVSYMAAQQESWWKTSYIKILKGEISCVRYTIIENPNEYPKAWRILERIV